MWLKRSETIFIKIETQQNVMFWGTLSENEKCF